MAAPDTGQAMLLLLLSSSGNVVGQLLHTRMLAGYGSLWSAMWLILGQEDLLLGPKAATLLK